MSHNAASITAQVHMPVALLHINGTTLFAGARCIGPLWQGYVRAYTGSRIAESTGLPRQSRGDALAEADAYASQLADQLDGEHEVKRPGQAPTF